jgi:translocation and assembly module TamA
MNQRLSQSGYFATVEVRPGLGSSADGSVPVEVALSPRPPHGFTAGAGASTDEGPRGRLGYRNRRVNRRGHQWWADARASLIEQSAVAEYRIPLEDPQSEWLSFQAGFERDDTDTSVNEAVKLAVRRTQVVLGDWLQTQFIELSREDFEVGRQSGIATLLVPGLSMSRTVADSPMRPSRGYRIYAQIRGTHEAIGSDASFLRANAHFNLVRELPWGGRLLARTEIGAMETASFEALPPSQRFFAGGDTSVRGYDYESLGPEDESGEVIGGSYLFVGSIEYEHPVRPGWSVAAFVDAGNAFDEEAEGNELKVGIGIGARRQTPIGPIRLDLAHPLDDDELVRVHFRLGPDL